MSEQQNPRTYKVVATFEAKDGSGRRKYKTIGSPTCIGAACYPEGGAR